MLPCYFAVPSAVPEDIDVKHNQNQPLMQADEYIAKQTAADFSAESL